jgi:hypothetical protein
VNNTGENPGDKYEKQEKMRKSLTGTKDIRVEHNEETNGDLEKKASRYKIPKLCDKNSSNKGREEETTNDNITQNNLLVLDNVDDSALMNCDQEALLAMPTLVRFDVLF